jgi:hypothetical protein
VRQLVDETALMTCLCRSPDTVTTASVGTTATVAAAAGQRGITLTELLLVQAQVPGKHSARLDLKLATRARGIKRRRHRDNNLRRAGSPVPVPVMEQCGIPPMNEKPPAGTLIETVTVVPATLTVIVPPFPG